MSDLLDLYTKIECPYNKSHMIFPLRMPYHLQKCRRNFPEMEMSVCPYNATHEVRSAELKYHMMQCPNRTLLENDLPYNALQNAIFGKDEPVKKGCTDLPPPVKVQACDEVDLENWDEDESPMVIPQPSGRMQRRRQSGRHVQLRRPQTDSIAATMTAPKTSEMSRLNDLAASTSKDATRLNDLVASTSNDVTTTQAERSTHLTPSVLKSSLMQCTMPNSNTSPELKSNFTFMLGRGRARPDFHHHSHTQSRPFLQSSVPGPIRFGRGGLRPMLRN